MLSCHQLAGVLVYWRELARYPSPYPHDPKPLSRIIDTLSKMTAWNISMSQVP